MVPLILLSAPCFTPLSIGVCHCFSTHQQLHRPYISFRHGSSGCLTCHNKTKTIDSLDQPPKPLPNQCQTRSISSISASNQTLDPNIGAGCANTPEFVNHGLILWNQTRQNWVGNTRFDNRVQHPREPKVNWNATYESLLGSGKSFSQYIPLAGMVDFLVDVWEQEGMYD